MGIIGRLADRIVFSMRSRYLTAKRKRLKNPAPTIICNNCMAGIIYHDMGLQFRSPTVNLWINMDEYLTFLSDLDGFLGSELTEVSDSGYDFPVGRLSFGGKEVKLYFLHYESFENAKLKWDGRKARIDRSNLFVILTEANIKREYLEMFDTLPYENKLVVTGKSGLDGFNKPYFAFCKYFDLPTYKSGDTMLYKSRFSVRRRLDRVDYIGFLNKNFSEKA